MATPLASFGNMRNKAAIATMVSRIVLSRGLQHLQRIRVL